MLESRALSIAKRMRIALQLEHALSFVTKAYDVYLMNVARPAEFAGRNAYRHRYGDAYDHGRHIKLQLNAHSIKHRCRTLTAFRGKLFHGVFTLP